jgi:hypothetical protein
MASPVKGFHISGLGGFVCDMCHLCGIIRKINAGDKFAEVKWKKYRKHGIRLVYESCAEGIVKDFESEVK